MEVRERHRSGRIGWLRAAVLGANDGIVSTASLVLGVATTASNRQEILVAGIAAAAGREEDGGVNSGSLPHFNYEWH